MAGAIFPEFTASAVDSTQADALPMLRECAWDFTNDLPIFAGGQPVIVTGQEAVAVWAWNALHTVRGRYEIYTDGYGSDVENLIGTSWSSELKTAEARQYVSECLLASPYIRAVRDMELSFDDDTLTIRCRIESIYGDVEMEVA